jgi:hypothetical protein
MDFSEDIHDDAGNFLGNKRRKNGKIRLTCSLGHAIIIWPPIGNTSATERDVDEINMCCDCIYEPIPQDHSDGQGR